MITISLCIAISGILGFGIQLVSTSLNKPNLDGNKQLQIWNMMFAFGELYKTKRLILHYDEYHNSTASWKRSYQKIIKESKHFGGYFAANEISDDTVHRSRWMKLSNEITMNLYVSQNFLPLHQLLQDEIRLKQSVQSGQNNSSSSHTWMIQMPNNSSKKDMIEILDDLHLRYDTRSFCFTLKNKIEIYDVYKIHINSRVILKRVGDWTENNGLQISDRNIWKRRRSLEGYHFNVASIYSPPAITQVTDNCTNTENCFKGMFADVWNSLSIEMNFTYTISVTSDLFGSLVNGSFDGVVGMLQNGEADIAVADLTITNSRSSVVDFLPCLINSKEVLFVKDPNYNGLHFNGYIEPFSPLCWLGVALFLLVTPLILSAMIIFDPLKHGIGNEFVYCYGFIVQTLTMQMNMTMPTSTSHRIAFGTVLLGGILIYCYWDAMLISYLAVEKIHIPFETLHDLAGNSRYKLLVGRGSVHLDHFRYSNNPLHIKIWKEKIEPYIDELPAYDDLIKGILEDSHAVAYAETGMRHNEAYVNCQIRETGPAITASQLAWAIPKHSPFREAFRYHINKLKEVGIVKKFAETYDVDGGQMCPDYSGTPLNITQCITAFAILIVGICLCMASLVLEMCTPRRWLGSNCISGNRNLKTFLMKTAANTLEDTKTRLSLPNEQLIDQMNRMKEKYDTKLHHLIEENKKHHLREKQMQKNIDYLEDKHLEIAKTWIKMKKLS